MGIPVNLEESTLVRATIDRVREETKRKDSIDYIIRSLHIFIRELPETNGRSQRSPAGGHLQMCVSSVNQVSRGPRS
jgi:hypothetical protein